MQNALETMESTNKQLRAIIGRHKVDPNLNVNPLSMKLQGIIDAAVMGGVSNYEKVRYVRVPLPSLPGNHHHCIIRKKSPAQPTYNINKTPFESCDTEKDLGV